MTFEQWADGPEGRAWIDQRPYIRDACKAAWEAATESAAKLFESASSELRISADVLRRGAAPKSPAEGGNAPEFRDG